MEKIKYVTERELTMDDMEDILTTAFEGGINYWAMLDNTTPEWEKAREQVRERKEPKESIFYSEVALQVLLNGDSIKFEDAEEEEDSDNWLLNLENFKKGCTLYEQDRGSLTKKLEECSFDAEEADCLIQYAMFGEVVFG